MPHRLHLEIFENIHALPILHGRIEFTDLVRSAIRRVKPDVIAIELPPTLEAAFKRAVSRLPQVSVISYKTDSGQNSGQPVYLLIEPGDPFCEAARLADEQGIPLQLIDVDTDHYPQIRQHLPDPYSITRIGLAAYYREFIRASASDPVEIEDKRREGGMAYRLQGLSQQYQRILFICGMSHLERIKLAFSQTQTRPLERLHRDGIDIFNLHPDSCGEVMTEFPFITALHEYRRGELPGEPPEMTGLRKRFNALELITGGRRECTEEQLLDNAIRHSARRMGSEGTPLDRQRAIYHLFSEASRHYRQETGETVHIWQKRAFFRFSRNYAMAGGMLLPDLYQLLISARGCIDDNFAYALFRLATHYPWQTEGADLATIRLTPEDLWGGSRQIRFRPRKKSSKGMSQFGFLKRKRERRPGEWLEGFDDPSICSYPPEDIAIEGYGEFLRRKGGMQLSEELCRSEKFSSSMLDGIDMRETLRNIHEGAIYVKSEQRSKGGMGAVVMIFDEDRGGQHYPYNMTWLGEHDQESDMAFYATRPEDNIVGPGICRCEYGGFMLCYPPRRMYDVWDDPDYGGAQSRAEVLLMAALDYSLEKHVVYVAKRPPRSIFKQMAARIGRKIVYIPLGSLSPVKLKQLRIMHILSGHDKRDIAREYIW